DVEFAHRRSGTNEIRLFGRGGRLRPSRRGLVTTLAPIPLDVPVHTEEDDRQNDQDDADISQRSSPESLGEPIVGVGSSASSSSSITGISAVGSSAPALIRLIITSRDASLPKAVTTSPARRTVLPSGTITWVPRRTATSVDPSGQATSLTACPSAIDPGGMRKSHYPAPGWAA